MFACAMCGLGEHPMLCLSTPLAQHGPYLSGQHLAGDCVRRDSAWSVTQHVAATLCLLCDAVMLISGLSQRCHVRKLAVLAGTRGMQSSLRRCARRLHGRRAGWATTRAWRSGVAITRWRPPLTGAPPAAHRQIPCIPATWSLTIIASKQNKTCNVGVCHESLMSRGPSTHKLPTRLILCANTAHSGPFALCQS